MGKYFGKKGRNFYILMNLMVLELKKTSICVLIVSLADREGDRYNIYNKANKIFSKEQ